MVKNDGKPSWLETIKLTNRAFRIYYENSPVQTIVYMISMAWDSLTPYIGIYLSACIIDELTNGRNPQRLRMLVLITLLSAAVIGLGSAFLGRVRNIYNKPSWFHLEHIYAKKMLDMDFDKFDDIKTAQLRQTIRQYQSMGWGILPSLNIYGGLCKQFLTFFGGITLTISLFSSRVPENAGAYKMLDNPFVVLAVILLLIAVTYISPVLLNKSQEYITNGKDDLALGNNMFRFWGFLGGKSDVAMDVRMYRQDKLCDKFCLSKEAPFHSGSTIAKLGWGRQGLLKSASAAVAKIFTGIIYVFVCLKALAGAFGIGAVTQYIASIQRTADGVSSIVELLGYMRNNAAVLRSIFEFLDIPNDMYQGSLTVEKRSDRKYEVEFRNVSFKYPGSDSYSLKNVNMKFEIGKRFAVVGMNGSGKTTFIKLLCRLYDPTEGEILLNGINIRKYNYAECFFS